MKKLSKTKVFIPKNESSRIRLREISKDLAIEKSGFFLSREELEKVISDAFNAAKESYEHDTVFGYKHSSNYINSLNIYDK